MRKLLLLILFIPIIFACRQQRLDEKDQGVITFKIVYPDEIQKKGFASFLPTSMVTVFKEDNYKLSIKGELSLYKLEYISRFKGDSATTLFRIFDKKMFHNHEKGEHLFLFRKYEDTEIEYRKNETKEIAGIMCKKAIIHFNNPELQDCDVYYTEEVKFNRPKENSPFDEIPGALMEFQIQFKGLAMKFEAQDIRIKHVNDKEFHIPNNYNSTEQGEIDELVSTLIQ